MIVLAFGPSVAKFYSSDLSKWYLAYPIGYELVLLGATINRPRQERARPEDLDSGHASIALRALLERNNGLISVTERGLLEASSLFQL